MSSVARQPEYFLVLTGANTLTADTSNQPLFDSVGGGVLTLPTGAYFFEMLFSLSTMSSTSGNGALDIKGASGTATVGSVLWIALGADATANGNGGAAGTSASTGVSSGGANLVTAGVATGMTAFIKGTFRITVAGTIIPSFALVTGNAAVVAIGSYFRCQSIGGTAIVTSGPWS